MGHRLFVGNLSFTVSQENLAAYFSQAGTVKECVVMIDKGTGRSRGFAFVTMAAEAEAANAVSMFHGKALEGRVISVTEARGRAEGSAGGREGGSGGRKRRS